MVENQNLDAGSLNQKQVAKDSKSNLYFQLQNLYTLY
jgi:hypothetical protein